MDGTCSCEDGIWVGVCDGKTEDKTAALGQMSLSPLKNDSCSGEHGEGIALAFFLSDDGDDVVAETEVIFGQEKSMSITCAGSC